MKTGKNAKRKEDEKTLRNGMLVAFGAWGIWKIQINRKIQEVEESMAFQAAKESFPGKYGDMGAEQFAAAVSDMTFEEKEGLMNGIKGKLMEMKAVNMENADGDHITAELADSLTQQGWDVKYTNNDTGEVWYSQIKASEDMYYIRDGIVSTEQWAADNDIPAEDINIQVSSEAAKDNAEVTDSGIALTGVEADLLHLENSTQALDGASELMNALGVTAPVASFAILAYKIGVLHFQKKRQLITPEEFRAEIIKQAGISAGIVGGIAGAMAISPALGLGAIGALTVWGLWKLWKNRRILKQAWQQMKTGWRIAQRRAEALAAPVKALPAPQ